MLSFPIHYIEPVFRPPSEARSLILPVTNGCSWNRCTFCEMYTAPQKKFHTRSIEEIRADLEKIAGRYPVRRIFLADGDAMALSFRRLQDILTAIREILPEVERVSSYCLPRNLHNKTVEELQVLREQGLKMVYIGCESGDDEVLRRVNKGETFASSQAALDKLGAAGITRSVMILTGLGGTHLSRQHAENSARLMNATQPEYLSTLVVTFPLGEQRFRDHYPDFTLPDTAGLLQELEIFVNALDLNNTVFRSDHASNYLVLKGRLSIDKASLLAQIRHALNHPDEAHLRPEWLRGL
ncbi:MAG: radical SAM protein [Neisseria sp.]|nr:radical SAM protein [Neisseria sp.]